VVASIDVQLKDPVHPLVRGAPAGEAAGVVLQSVKNISASLYFTYISVCK
jgi:hypothetical protein